jgi:RNA polymerase sporulation-specific sigma factor
MVAVRLILMSLLWSPTPISVLGEIPMPKPASVDPVTVEQLVNDNMKLSWFLAQRYLSTRIPLDDLISITNFGLFKAARTFDPTKGFKFSTYATRCMENELRLEIRNRKKHNRTCYLEDTVCSDYDDGNQLTIEDIIPDHKAQHDFSRYETVQHLEMAIDNFIATVKQGRTINPNNRRNIEIVILRVVEGWDQRRLCEKYGMTQPILSRLIKQTLGHLRTLHRELG